MEQMWDSCGATPKLDAGGLDGSHRKDEHLERGRHSREFAFLGEATCLLGNRTCSLIEELP